LTMKVAELRAELASRGLDTKGKKAELEARLQALETVVLGADGADYSSTCIAAPAPAPKTTVAELRAELASRGLDTKGKKAELEARLLEPETSAAQLTAELRDLKAEHEAKLAERTASPRFKPAMMDESEQARRATEQLYAAADDGTAAEVTRLLAAGADPNEIDIVRACARAASLPAAPVAPPAPLSAARHSSSASHRCHTLQDHENGDNALMKASFNGHMAIVRALLGAGATLETINKAKVTYERDYYGEEIEIVRPPRRRPASASAHRRPLTHRVRRTAAPPGSSATPP
jgi:hypothetical protein